MRRLKKLVVWSGRRAQSQNIQITSECYAKLEYFNAPMSSLTQFGRAIKRNSVSMCVTTIPFCVY